MHQKATPTATKLAIKQYVDEVWRQRKYSLPALFFVSIGTVFTTYVPPLVIAAVIKRFGNHTPTLNELLPYLFMFAGAWFLGEVLWRICFLFLSKADGYGMQHLYISGLDQLKQRDIKFFHNNFAGSLTKKVLGYGKSFEGFFDTLTFKVAKHVLPLIFVSVILWRFSPWIVAALYLLSILVVIAIVPPIKKRKKMVDEREEASNTMAGHVADVIGNIDAVQAFGHEAEEQARHEQNVKHYIKKALRSWDYHTLHIDFAISPIYVFVNVLGLALAILLGDDSTTIAVMFVTFSYFTFITEMLWQFNQTYRGLENAIAEAAQFTQLTIQPVSVSDPANPKPFNITQGAVEFKDVHFTYDSDNQPLFADLNLKISPGEKIALAGHSGGGKTTITKLVLRFADVTSGSLLIDGQNVSEVKLKDLRQSIAYVPQEPSMFHRSIRENIRYGKLDATDDQVVTAAKKANAHEFISQLPHGYDTLVGERGVKLSGGQRQRVAIARAIIKDAPILVLDEATSALDSESEKLIQAALWELMEGRTAIVIAHRLSTIQKMDRIVVLDKGHIAEQGSHGELLRHKGIYAKLWAHQSGGFLEE